MIGLILGAIAGVLLVAAGAYSPRNARAAAAIRREVPHA